MDDLIFMKIVQPLLQSGADVALGGLTVELQEACNMMKASQCLDPGTVVRKGLTQQPWVGHSPDRLFSGLPPD